jgi:hypothetical protein
METEESSRRIKRAIAIKTKNKGGLRTVGGEIFTPWISIKGIQRLLYSGIEFPGRDKELNEKLLTGILDPQGVFP